MNPPVPWLGPSPSCDATDYWGIVGFMKGSLAAAQDPELLEALTLAAARADASHAIAAVPPYVRCAQAMLEMAVEWRMPVVERWAVAWLIAIGDMQLRLRWSTRSRDGRFRQEAQATDRVQSVAAHAGTTFLGLASGAVESWAKDGALQTLMAPMNSPVWAVAARDDRIVAAGTRNTFQALGWSPPPPLLTEPTAGQRAVAISSGGGIAMGDEQGRLRTWEPGQRWDIVHPPVSSPARAIAFAGPAGQLVRAVWESGEVRELDLAAGHRTWSLLHRFPAGVRAAAWNRSGAMLAAATGGEIWLVSARPGEGAVARLLWAHPGVEAVAWSDGDVLASAGLDQITASTAPLPPYPGEVGYTSIKCDEHVKSIALPDSGRVVSVQDSDLVQWELNGVSSNDPTFSADDRITTVAVQPGDRRTTLAGTQRGHLREYSATGTLLGETELPADTKIKRLAWDGQSRSWMVASLDGIYRFRPPGPPQHIAKGLSRHVAADGGRYIYATNNRVTTSDARTFKLPSEVTDLRADHQGTLAAIDYSGHVRVQRPGGNVSKGPDQKPGTRLLDIDGDALLFSEPNGRMVMKFPDGDDRSFGEVPARSLTAVRYDDDRIVVAYQDQGILLASADARPNTWMPARVTGMAVNAGRIVIATPNQLAGYDVLDARERKADGSLMLDVQSGEDGFTVTLPTGVPVHLAGDAVRSAGNMLRERRDRPTLVRQLSEAVFQAGRIGDLLWHGGLDLAIDHARGPDPNRPVRLNWRVRPGDSAADHFPWELLHPSAMPLGWFDDPAVTSVRVITPSRKGPGTTEFAAGVSPTMLVVRGTAAGLDAVDDAFDRFRRRSRRTDVRLVAAKPKAVGSARELATALVDPVDILQLWMHSGDAGVQLSDDPGSLLETAALVSMLARNPPRLAVLVGCSSGALGRALVQQGVLAALAMRVPVYDHTVQPLVEDVTAAALAGVPIDLAFAGALRRYVMTGQPGAAAVPMLYLAANAGGVLFPKL